MSQTPIGGHPQGWEHKLADRASLPPASGEERSKSQSKHVYVQPHTSKMGMGSWREETEGSSGSSIRSPSSVSPPYIRWARTLHDLLEDAEGVRLFRKFVGGAGGLHVDRLNFYFAVQGLRQETEPDKIRLVVSAIYKFLRKSQLAMPEELKQHVKQSLKDGLNIERTIFDNMEMEVTRAITETTYQAFLRSEAYVSYVSAATQPLSSPDASPPLTAKEPALSGLATLHEGQELCAAPARLTHNALMATQGRRLRASAPNRKRSVYSAHVTYGGYCPTSRQDSERASLSSGRTDSDAVSISSSVECRERPRRVPRIYGVERHAVMNKEQDTLMVIPRTQRPQAEQPRVLPPEEFAPLLIEKLERVRKMRDSHDRFERRLAEGDGEDAATQALPPQLVAAAIREKLQLDDDNDQDILDQHVSRVWSERTPGASPPGGRRARGRGPPRAPPAPRRASSALSADSGHFDAPSEYHAHAHHALYRRSGSRKTVTELTDSGVSVVSEGASAWGAVERRDYALSSRGSSLDRDDLHERTRRRERSRGSGSKSSSTTSGGGGGGGGAAATEVHTVVVMTFLDESVPYRIKVPAAPLTLKTFKEYLPRKGNYRYFFKTECADLDNTVIQEEVSNDADTLPMFEGKVMARVKSIE